MSRPARTPAAPRARARAAAGAVVLAAALAGCGLRLETPPPPLPSPDALEAARQAAAHRAASVADLAARAGAATEGEQQALLGRTAQEAGTHLQRLGGVWEPPDWAPPSGGASPGPASPPDGPRDGTEPTPDDVAAALRGAADGTCADAVGLPPSDLAALLASMCLAQRSAAAALGAEAPALPAPGERDALSAAAATSRGGDLARALDAAGFALEVLAARTAGSGQDAWAARAAQYRDAAQRLLAEAGTLGGPQDPRRAAYALGPDAAVDVGAAEADVLRAWTSVAAQVTDQDRAAVLAEMAEAALRARAAGADLGALPGLR